MKSLLGTGVLLPAMLLACAGPGSPGPAHGLDIHFIDVEGGAATLIVTPAGESILVDSGMPGNRDPERIVRYAREQAGLSRIDHHLITHWDIDHFGGTEQIGALIPIVRYYDHGPTLAQEEARYRKAYDAYLQIPPGRRQVVKPGDVLPLRSTAGTPPLSLRVVAAHARVLAGSPPNPPDCPRHPGKPDAMNDNAGSIAFVLTYGPFDFYDGADLLWNLEHRLACPNPVLRPVDVMQVTHHGLPVSNHPALQAVLSPCVAIMNNGDRKGCDPEVLKTLKASPGLEAWFQLHLNLRLPSGEQAPASRIANREPAKDCKAEPIVVRVSPDGASYTVTVGKDGAGERFMTR